MGKQDYPFSSANVTEKHSFTPFQMRVLGLLNKRFDSLAECLDYLSAQPGMDKIGKHLTDIPEYGIMIAAIGRYISRVRELFILGEMPKVNQEQRKPDCRNCYLTYFYGLEQRACSGPRPTPLS